MLRYTQAQLDERSKIIESQTLFGKFLDAEIINKFIHLFDNKNTNIDKNDKITKYIEDERSKQGLDISNVLVESEVYGYTVKNSTLHLQIKKNNKDFIHLTIHISPEDLPPQHSTMIHISKDIYKEMAIPSKLKRTMYALISIKQPIDKPNSLEFSIADGYNTVGVPDAHLYDPEIQKEMNVIITVLNKIFDENNEEYYIGNKLYPIHNKTNIVLKNINTRTKYTVRKNIGKTLMPELTNTNIFNVKRKTNKSKYIKKNKRITRKRKIINTVKI
jgi:hypothetical protein